MLHTYLTPLLFNLADDRKNMTKFTSTYNHYVTDRYHSNKRSLLLKR